MRAFTYPFRYTPSEEVRREAAWLAARLDEAAGNPFREGKMMGVLLTDKGPLYAYSGLAAGMHISGLGDVPFVPPIFDYTTPDGYFRRREAEISAMEPGPLKSRSSADLQVWLSEQYKVLNARGEEKTIREVFASRGIVPPGGTGECAAPKLLQHAYAHGMKPISMGEFWYGAAPHGDVREHGRFYPACFGKCGPLLSYMMEGLDVEPNPLDKDYFHSEPAIIYSDEAIIIADKPSGMLSVPGKTGAKSLLEWLQERFGEVHSCHRLDMDTSGVMVFARTMETKVEMERQFASREVSKTYRARLCAGSRPFGHANKGTIALPLMLDYYDRPRQTVSETGGKKAVTRYEVLEVLPNGEIDIRFTPLTGRSHQLRVHAAHADGLGRPIKGDALYGDPTGNRLYLHAESISFRHPSSGENVRFASELGTSEADM